MLHSRDMSDDKIQHILDFWFGNLEDANVPSTERTDLWFGADENVDKTIREIFFDDLQRAIQDEYIEWEETARGRLALIILLDQFSRSIYRNTPEAYSQDNKALALCLQGIQREQDHTLSLIERVFFYMPLEHAEKLEVQVRSVMAYQVLVDLSLPELVGVFQGFLNYAVWHYEIIRRFGRFPQRNAILGRDSTTEELEFTRRDNLIS
jgi:uncharacterized protein (DUF924 family)